MLIEGFQSVSGRNKILVQSIFNIEERNVLT